VTSSLPGAEDTIVAQATAGARSALAVIRLSGSDALCIGARLLSPWKPLPGHAYLATLRDPTTHRVIDRGIVTTFIGSASYTGEDMLELSLHGGEVGPALAIMALIQCGARPALPGEFTKRAFLNGKMDLLQAEAIADLIDARSRAMHDVAMAQLDGNLSARLNALREMILELEALLAYDVDFPEEDEGPVAPARITTMATALLAAIDGLLATADTGEMIRGGAVVVIAGVPNAGKSSLFNALVGAQRAIVTEIPGTTRDAIEAMIDIDRWPIRLVDTAGLRSSEDLVERLGIDVAEHHVKGAALVLLCGEDRSSLVAAVERVKELTTAPLLVVGTKSDLGQLPEEEYFAGIRYVRVSARSGEGLHDLTRTIAGILDGERVPPSATNPVLTRERHRIALTAARTDIAAFVENWQRNGVLPATVAAVLLQSARGQLEELIGSIDVEEVLDRVFSSFCVGK
jgi:tRNA modification GTPase